MILAIDPGKMTGVATLDPHVWDLPAFWSGEIPDGIEGFARWFTNGWPHLTIAVIEKYTIGAKQRAIREDYNAVYINGFIIGSAVAQDWDVKQQIVSPVKTFATNDKLRKLGWWKGGAGHADDASRHLLAYIAKRPIGQRFMEQLIND